MPPVVIAGAVAAGGAIAASSISSKATKKAAQTTAQSNANSTALQGQIYDQNKAALQPWQTAGLKANDVFTSALGMAGPEKAKEAFDLFTKSTGYEWQRDQGMRALNSGYAGRRVLQSGAAVKGAEAFGQNFARSAYQDWLGTVGSLQSLGFNAASAQAGVGQAFANNVTQLNSQNAATQAQLALARGQSSAGMVSALGQTAGYVAGNVFGSSPSPYAPLVPSVNSAFAENPGIF